MAKRNRKLKENFYKRYKGNRKLKQNFYRRPDGSIQFRQMIRGELITGSTGMTDPYKVNKNATEIKHRIISDFYALKKEKTLNPKYKLLLVEYLRSKKSLSSETIKTYRVNISFYIRNGLPHSCSKSRVNSVRRDWNIFARWCIKKGYQVTVLEGDTSSEGRTRVFNDKELRLILNKVKPLDFRSFVAFSYYTGMRRGELSRLNKAEIYKDYLICSGKSGRRVVKLNNQAISILMDRKNIWEYNLEFITKKFKKELRRLGINGAVFHDLRRTFGYNLILSGMPIYNVSKLLGHKSVKTTEQHYAPLLPTQIEDFTLPT